MTAPSTFSTAEQYARRLELRVRRAAKRMRDETDVYRAGWRHGVAGLKALVEADPMSALTELPAPDSDWLDWFVIGDHDSVAKVSYLAATTIGARQAWVRGAEDGFHSAWHAAKGQRPGKE